MLEETDDSKCFLLWNIFGNIFQLFIKVVRNFFFVDPDDRPDDFVGLVNLPLR